MRGRRATGKGIRPGHRTGFRELKALREAGASPDQRGPHHWILSRAPWIEWWPSRSKYRLGMDGPILMAGFADMVGDVTDLIAASKWEPVACSLCGNPVREPYRYHHEKCLLRVSYGPEAYEKARIFNV